MVLKELDLGNEVKCTCESCEGTGLYKGFAERDDLAVLCRYCNGKGYNVLKLGEKIQLVKDEKTGLVYKVKDGIIVGAINIFDKRQEREGVNYVMYSTGRVLSPEYLFTHGASEINVIRYKEFLEGMYPLPMMQYSCPRQITQVYGDCSFDNDCTMGDFSECEKYGTQECWEKFYGKAETIEEKQNVMKAIR